MGRLFGTDGIRGKAKEHPMTSEIALKVGRAAAFVLTKKLTDKRKKAKILIGKDTRLSGYMLESALSSGINSLGADSLLVGPMPTPAIAFLTQDMRADASFVISASHNPYYDNGIKIFSSNGFKPVSYTHLIVLFYIFLVYETKASRWGQSFKFWQIKGKNVKWTDK